MAEGEAWDRRRDHKISQVAEVKRRLDRFPKTGVSVGYFPGEEHDVIVTVAPPNSELAARVVQLCPDIAIRVTQCELAALIA